MMQLNKTDFLLLFGIGIIWGSQFVFTEIAIESVSPLTVAASRVFIGFITLSFLSWIVPVRKQQSQQNNTIRQPWGMYCLIALAEGVLPCFLIPWGQQYVDSSVAAILMATIPIFTLSLTMLFVKKEPWSFWTVSSVVTGFVGVIILVGLGAAKGGWVDNAIPKLAIIGAAFSFSVSLILMRKLPSIPPLLVMRNILMIAAIPMVILSLFFDQPWQLTGHRSSLFSLLVLGVFCGGIVYLMVIILVNRAGATFTSLNNYLVTVVGVLIGIVFMNDQLQVYDGLALGLILVALLMSQYKKQKVNS